MHQNAAFIASLVALFLVALLPGSAQKFAVPLASPFESRVGTVFMPGPKHLRLDIGYRWDVAVVRIGDSAVSPVVIDSDFFTLTRLRSEGNFKFPVETIDYWFGLGAHWRYKAVQSRVRLAHVSTHLVDGLANADGLFEQQKPFVYSREFAELMLGVQTTTFRPYLGLTYVWASIPRDINRIIPQFGCDAQLPAGHGSVVVGVDARYTGFESAASLSTVLQCGYRFDADSGPTTTISIMRYDGRSVHGMFSRQFDHYWALTVQITPL